MQELSTGAASGHPTKPPSRAALGLAWIGAGLFTASMAFFLYCYLVLFGRAAPTGPIAAPAAANVLLFSAFALHHSALARSGARAFVARAVTPPLERVLYTWTASLLFIAVCWAWRPLPGTAYQLSGPAFWVGIGVQLAGLVVTHLGARAIDVLDLAGVRQVLAARRGADRQHVALTTTGIYGLVRHPIYLGWMLFVFGVPTMTTTRLLFACVSSVYILIAIPFEERALDDVFGEAYAAYRARVRWRVLPGVW